MENQTQKTSIKDRVVSWLLRALLEQFRAAIQQLTKDLEGLVVREQLAFLKEARAAARPSAYVTLRVRWTNPGDTGLAAAWTIPVDVHEGHEASVPFTPQNRCTIERVDVVGPAVIVAVRVGQQYVTQPRAEYQSSIDLATDREVGWTATVTFKGLP